MILHESVLKAPAAVFLLPLQLVLPALLRMRAVAPWHQQHREALSDAGARALHPLNWSVYPQAALRSGGALGCNLFPPTVLSGRALPPAPLGTGIIRYNLNAILALSVFTKRWRPIGCDHISVQRLFPSGFLCRACVLFYIRSVFCRRYYKA